LFISYNNVFEILKHAPLVSFGFLILIAINLLVAYFQISLLFIGARHLLYHEKRTLIEYSRKVFRESIAFMKCLTVSKALFIFVYIAMIFPFIRKIFKIYSFLKKKMTSLSATAQRQKSLKTRSRLHLKWLNLTSCLARV